MSSDVPFIYVWFFIIIYGSPLKASLNGYKTHLLFNHSTFILSSLNIAFRKKTKKTCPPRNIVPYEGLLWHLVLVRHAEIWWESVRYDEIWCDSVRFYNNVRYGSHGPLLLQPSRLDYTLTYTLDSFIHRSHVPGANAHAVVHSV